MLTSDNHACLFQPSMNSAHQLMKPLLSEIRDMTNEDSSIEEQEGQRSTDYSNGFEIKQGIKWDELVRFIDA